MNPDFEEALLSPVTKRKAQAQTKAKKCETPFCYCSCCKNEVLVELVCANILCILLSQAMLLDWDCDWDAWLDRYLPSDGCSQRTTSLSLLQ